MEIKDKKTKKVVRRQKKRKTVYKLHCAAKEKEWTKNMKTTWTETKLNRKSSSLFFFFLRRYKLSIMSFGVKKADTWKKCYFSFLLFCPFSFVCVFRSCFETTSRQKKKKSEKELIWLMAFFLLPPPFYKRMNRNI